MFLCHWTLKSYDHSNNTGNLWSAYTVADSTEQNSLQTFHWEVDVGSLTCAVIFLLSVCCAHRWERGSYKSAQVLACWKTILLVSPRCVWEFQPCPLDLQSSALTNQPWTLPHLLPPSLSPSLLSFLPLSSVIQPRCIILRTTCLFMIHKPAQTSLSHLLMNMIKTEGRTLRLSHWMSCSLAYSLALTGRRKWSHMIIISVCVCVRAYVCVYACVCVFL